MVEAAKRNLPAMAICSTAFATLGRSQAKALGYPDLPIAIVPHPFGIRTRSELKEIAVTCADDIARLLSSAASNDTASPVAGKINRRADTLAVPDDPEGLNRYFMERHWGDGFPVIAPTPERVARMLSHTRRAPDEVVGKIAPGYGEATVERIAINAVLAGCHPEYLPVLIAAAEAVSAPEFNLQGIQATTNPGTVFLIINGPIARKLGVNSGNNCLGQGTWANATLGRGLRLILQNIGGAQPGEMDRATQGQPGKYSFCCAENEEASPWEALHVERGFSPGTSTVTVVPPLGTWNMNTHAKDVDDLLKVFADIMAFPGGSDYVYGGGAPWLVMAPEHAHILKVAGLSKADVRIRLWEQSKMSAMRLSAKDFARTQNGRRAELGEITRETMLPISPRPECIGIIVAGGPGTHSVYMPGSGYTRAAITREIVL
jgi:hypothetical protein